MNLPKFLFGKSSHSTEAMNVDDVVNGENKPGNRRRQDHIKPMTANQILNLDRRASNSDRRVNHDHNYNGPARRYTIDRRMSAKDRRDET